MPRIRPVVKPRVPALADLAHLRSLAQPWELRRNLRPGDDPTALRHYAQGWTEEFQARTLLVDPGIVQAGPSVARPRTQTFARVALSTSDERTLGAQGLCRLGAPLCRIGDWIVDCGCRGRDCLSKPLNTSVARGGRISMPYRDLAAHDGLPHGAVFRLSPRVLQPDTAWRPKEAYTQELRSRSAPEWYVRMGRGGRVAYVAGVFLVATAVVLLRPFPGDPHFGFRLGLFTASFLAVLIVVWRLRR